MRDAGPASLLDFAIIASIAVLPVLLAVLLGMRSISSSGAAYPGEAIHVSVRQVAALKTFERAIVRRDAVRPAAIGAESLLAQLPDCAAEWDGRERVLIRLKAMLGRASADGQTPAQRIARQLVALDEALLRMSSGGNRRIADPVGLDLGRWADAARLALATPVEAEKYPARAFGVRCSDLASAVAMLARGGGRMLTRLAWRGTEVERTTARWRPDQYVAISPRYLARSNPWAGVQGCVYLWDQGSGSTDRAPAFFIQGIRSTSERVCAQPSVYALAGTEGAVGGADAPVSITAGDPAPGDGADEPRWQVPPSLHALLRPLDALQRPSGSLYRAFANEGGASGREESAERASRQGAPVEAASRVGRPGNRVRLDGAEVDVGFSVDLTIDPALQALAQKTAACYTGRQDACRSLAIRRTEDGTQVIGHRMLEHAVVRMAAIAIIDVASGRIEALAGALSPCTRQEHDGPGRDARCDDRLPYPVRYRPDALLNPAVFHDAMPASVVKPVMAAAFLSNATVGGRWLAAERAAMRVSAPPPAESLRGQLMRSSSARFLDRMFCADQGFRSCERPWEIQAVSRAFGWNAGCAEASEQCGRHDLLFGRPLAVADPSDGRPIAAWVPYGRLMVEPTRAAPGAPFRGRPTTALDATWVKRCAAGPDGRRGSRDDWEKCRGGVVVDVVAEGWGQGHARSTALGAAGMMAALAAAANGQTEVRRPHLVRSVRGTATPAILESAAAAGTSAASAPTAAAAPIAIASDTASPTAAGDLASAANSALGEWAAVATEPHGLSPEAADVILDGLSYSHRYGTARLACEQVLDARRCRDIDWIAGKTGTPTFPNDDRSLDDLAKLCAPGTKRTVIEQVACGGLRPYKWYVAAYRTDRSDPRWTKVIGVLTERNWLAESGRVHGAGDHGPNPASEIALQIATRHVGVPGQEVR